MTLAACFDMVTGDARCSNEMAGTDPLRPRTAQGRSATCSCVAKDSTCLRTAVDRTHAGFALYYSNQPCGDKVGYTANASTAFALSVGVHGFAVERPGTYYGKLVVEWTFAGKAQPALEVPVTMAALDALLLLPVPSLLDVTLGAGGPLVRREVRIYNMRPYEVGWAVRGACRNSSQLSLSTCGARMLNTGGP